MVDIYMEVKISPYKKELSKNLSCLSTEHILHRGGNFLSLKGFIRG